MNLLTTIIATYNTLAQSQSSPDTHLSAQLVLSLSD